jgi:hypothetical protein
MVILIIRYKMILTVDRKKKFLVTMLVIMGCATMINFGLFNVLNSYFNNGGNNNDDDTEQIYSNVQRNIIIVLIVIAFVTVIMVVLIPTENVKEIMARIEAGGGGSNNNGAGTVSLEGSGNTLGTDDDDTRTDEQKLSDMIDEELEEDNKK